MPELAEVEMSRRLAEAVAVGRSIERAECAHDPIVVEGSTAPEVEAALCGANVLAAHRRGKALWLQLNRAPHPVFHFGMTGAFRSPNHTPVTLASSPKGGDNDWPPRFAKLTLHLSDGGTLVFTNKRRLGRLRLRQNPIAEPPLSELGFDPYLDSPDPAAFAALIGHRRAPIKAVLLDQSVAAGVGNWLADDILYAAGISPMRVAASLSRSEVNAIVESMVRIVKMAVNAEADSRRFPPTWLFHHRWTHNQGAHTPTGEPIAFTQVAGRTTVWVPSRQQ